MYNCTVIATVLTYVGGSVVCMEEFVAVPINSIPIIPTALARNTSGPLVLSKVQQRVRCGYLTMEETRKLILLLDTEPKLSSLPIVGLWVSGVESIHHPRVWSACVGFCCSNSIVDR